MLNTVPLNHAPHPLNLYFQKDANVHIKTAVGRLRTEDKRTVTGYREVYLMRTTSMNENQSKWRYRHRLGAGWEIRAVWECYKFKACYSGEAAKRKSVWKS